MLSRVIYFSFFFLTADVISFSFQEVMLRILPGSLKHQAGKQQNPAKE